MKVWALSLFVLVILTSLIGCSSDKEKLSTVESQSTITLEEIQLQATDFLKKDNEISDFTIDSITHNHKNKDGAEVYLLFYSMKPSNPENFILAGSGIMESNGWIRERVYYVTVKDNHELTFSTSP